MKKSVLLFIVYLLFAIVTFFQKPWTSTYVGVKIDASFQIKKTLVEDDLRIYQWRSKKSWINFSIATKEYFHSIIPSSEDLLRDYWKAFYMDAPIDWTEFNLKGRNINNIEVKEFVLSDSQKISYIKVGVRKSKNLFAGDLYLMVGLKQNHPFYINFQSKEQLDSKQLHKFLSDKFCFE